MRLHEALDDVEPETEALAVVSGVPGKGREQTLAHSLGQLAGVRHFGHECRAAAIQGHNSTRKK